MYSGDEDYGDDITSGLINFDLAPGANITFGIGSERGFRTAICTACAAAPATTTVRAANGSRDALCDSCAAGSCPNCGSPDPDWQDVAYDGPSGVSHPDGGQEIIHESGRKCRRCGAVQEDR